MYNIRFKWFKYQTDKSDVFIKRDNKQILVNVGHGYGRAYDKHLYSGRESVKKVLEIGTRQGSVMLWLDYFPNAKIYGIDLIDPKVSHERFTYENVDQSNRAQLEKFFDENGSDFDIIVDDGLHAAYEQQVSLDVCFDKVTPGGFYIIEDMHCQREEEKDGPHYRPTVNTNMDMYKLIEEFQKEKYDTCTAIKNVELFKEKIQKIYIETARNCRWITMSKPSEIIFIEKSMSSE